MKSSVKTLRLLVIVFGVVALAIGLASCKDGDGGGLTLDEYFTRLQEIDQAAEQRFDEVDGQLGEPEDVEAVKDIFPDLLAVAEDFFTDIEALDPPEEARDAHDAAVAAGREVEDRLEALLDRTEDMQSLDEFFAATQDSALSAAEEAFSAACLDLEQIAASNNIDIDLSCEE